VEEGSKVGSRHYEAVAGQSVEILFYRVGWILEPLANFPNGVTQTVGVQGKETAKKLVRVLNIKAIGSKSRLRKILEVLRHNDMAPANDGSGQNVTIIRIGRSDNGNEGSYPVMRQSRVLLSL
jgi:hypothetical protein